MTTNLNALRRHMFAQNERLAADCLEIAMVFLDLTAPDWTTATPYLKLAIRWASGEPVGTEATPPLHKADCLYRRPKSSMVCVQCGQPYLNHPETVDDNSATQ